MPAYAWELLLKVCAEEQIPVPSVGWRVKHGVKQGYPNRAPEFTDKGVSFYWPSARAWIYKHRLTFTVDPRMPERWVRWLVLHEVAHLIHWRRHRWHKPHGLEFWRVAFRLYKQHGLYWFALRREGYRRARLWARQIAEEERRQGSRAAS